MSSLKYFVVMVLSFMVSCDLIDKLLTFDIDQSYSFTIPAVGHSSNMDSITLDQEVNTEIKQDLENNNTRNDLVKSIILKSLVAEITSPNNQTFSPINDIEIYLSTNNQPDILVAHKYNIQPNVGNKVVMDTSGELLDEYLKEETIKVTMETTFDETTLSATTVDLDLVFQVTATPFN